MCSTAFSLHTECYVYRKIMLDKVDLSKENPKDGIAQVLGSGNCFQAIS